MRAMSRIFSSKRGASSEKNRGPRTADAREEAPSRSMRGGASVGSVSLRGGEDTITPGDTAENDDEMDPLVIITERLALAEARVFDLERSLEHAVAMATAWEQKAATATRRAFASEQRERNAFYERNRQHKEASVRDGGGMPRGPRWLGRDEDESLEAETSTQIQPPGTIPEIQPAETPTQPPAITPAALSELVQQASHERTLQWIREVDVAVPGTERTALVPSTRAAHPKTSVAGTSTKETQTEPTEPPARETTTTTARFETARSASSPDPYAVSEVPEEVPEPPKRPVKPFHTSDFADVAIGDVKSEITRARRAAKQSDDKQRQMIAQLNAYRRSKDQSEIRVRELAVELAEVTRDSKVWQVQEQRVGRGLAGARVAYGTPRPPGERGGGKTGDRGGGEISFPFSGKTHEADYADVSHSDVSDSEYGDDTAGEGGGLPSDGDHPIFKQIRHGRVHETAALLSSERDACESNCESKNARDKFGNAPLIVAAQNNRKRIMKLLVKSGVDLNSWNLEGNTALHYAYAYGHWEVAEYLTRRGADENARNNKGEAPIDAVRGDAEASRRFQAAKEQAEKRRTDLDAKRSVRAATTGALSQQRPYDSDDGFGTDADCGSDTESDASRDDDDGETVSPRNKNSHHRSFDDDVDVDDTENGLSSYRALYSGRG
jgi:hypothetical protein